MPTVWLVARKPEVQRLGEEIECKVKGRDPCPVSVGRFDQILAMHL